MNLVAIVHSFEQGGSTHNFHYKGNAMISILESVDRESDYTFIFEKSHDDSFERKTLKQVWGKRVRVGDAVYKVGDTVIS